MPTRMSLLQVYTHLWPGRDSHTAAAIDDVSGPQVVTDDNPALIADLDRLGHHGVAVGLPSEAAGIPVDTTRARVVTPFSAATGTIVFVTPL